MPHFRNNLVISLVAVSALLGMAFGCSNNGGSPAVPDVPGMPELPENLSSLVQPVNPAESGRDLWGIYNLVLNPDTMEIEVIPNRELEAHFNITSMLTNPNTCPNLNCIVLMVTSYIPPGMFHLAVTLRNPTFLAAYDVRGIFVNNPGVHELTNPDNYTDLYFGSPNPFKAYAKAAPKRKFLPASVYSENYYIQFEGPPFNFNVLYAIDASWPSSCKEPYWIRDIETEGIMTTQRGCAYLTLKAYDWNGCDDVESVVVDTYPFDGSFTEFEQVPGTNEWHALILNSFQTTVGVYDLLIAARSYDSPLSLYDYVTIEVIEPVNDDPYQGTVIDSMTSMPVEEAMVITSDGMDFFIAPTDMCGVYELPDVPEGKRVISFAKPYYITSHTTTIYEGVPLLIDGNLQPTVLDPPPLPVANINDPFVDWEFGEASITGTVENLDYPTAVMCLNHEEYLIDVDELTGEFEYPVTLMPGMNYIRVRATNATGSVFSEEKTVNYILVDYPFKLTLTWDTLTDQDLHGWDPDFVHCYYDDMDITKMFLDVDIITEGYGPETITGTGIIPGRYYFAVNYYYEHAESGDTLNTVDVIVNPGTAYQETEVFQHTLNYGNSNEGYPVYGDTASWWRVCDIVIDDNLICHIEPADTSVGLPH